ncbi:unnamed protein product [Musa acuminata var. zebrina]
MLVSWQPNNSMWNMQVMHELSHTDRYKAGGHFVKCGNLRKL